mmetsp:Transcript_54907/g.139166  ORF Transcript_54907/g.139166 Transcript_54907/m.139166 type:complete len:209 (+) Transcript_54907:173-799(+)
MRTASNAPSSVRQILSSVCTDRILIQYVPADRTLSAQAKSKSSSATQDVTSGCFFNHSVISLARRSTQARTPCLACNSGFGEKIGVHSLNTGMSWLLSTAPMEDLSLSVRRHSDDSTIMAPVCWTIALKEPSAVIEKSLSLTVSRTGSVTPSTTIISTAPLGKITPSTSKKIAFVRSSAGSVGRDIEVFSAAAFAAASLTGSGSGRKS